MKLTKEQLRNVVVKKRSPVDGRAEVEVYGHPLLPDGTRTYFYRYKMINKLGRVLLTSEHVHHKDGDKSNDRLSNLELKTGSAHSSHHSRKMWDEMSPERRAEIAAKISAAKKGKPQPWAVAAGKSLKGIKRSKEFREKVSAGMKAYCASLPKKEMARRSNCITEEGKRRAAKNIRKAARNRTPEKRSEIREKLQQAVKHRKPDWKAHLSRVVKKQWKARKKAGFSRL